MSDDLSAAYIRRKIAKLQAASDQLEFTSILQRTNHELMQLRLSKRIDQPTYTELSAELMAVFNEGRKRHRVMGI